MNSPINHNNQVSKNKVHSENESKAETIAEEIADYLPEVGNITSKALPAIGMALAPVAPEATLILNLVGKIAPIVLDAISDLIKEGIKIFDEKSSSSNQNEKSNTNIESLQSSSTDEIVQGILNNPELIENIGETIVESLSKMDRGHENAVLNEPFQKDSLGLKTPSDLTSDEPILSLPQSSINSSPQERMVSFDLATVTVNREASLKQDVFVEDEQQGFSAHRL